MKQLSHFNAKWKALDRYERKQLTREVMRSGYGITAVIIGALGISGLGITYSDAERFLSGALGGIIACFIVIIGLYKKLCD